MKRQLAVLSAGLCLSGSLVGAAAPAALAQSGGKVVTLTYWAGFTGGDMPTYVELVNLFNRRHPDIKVDMTIEPWDTLYQKLPSAMGSGGGPDIATPDYNVGTTERIHKGRLGPADQLVARQRAKPGAGRRNTGRHQISVHGERPTVRRARQTGRLWSCTGTRRCSPKRASPVPPRPWLNSSRTRSS